MDKFFQGNTTKAIFDSVEIEFYIIKRVSRVTFFSNSKRHFLMEANKRFPICKGSLIEWKPALRDKIQEI